MLRLDRNEGVPPAPESLRAGFEDAVRSVHRYPDAGRLEAMLALRMGIAPDRVFVTAGADDALDRACRALLGPGRELVLHAPTFETLQRLARQTGATLVNVPWWEGLPPVDKMLSRIGPATAAVAIVTPNNPTGSVADAGTLLRLSAAAPVLLVDLAYTEFADVDLTDVALAIPNALVFRTLSKAWGLAGLRVGYVAGPAPLVARLREVGNPYPLSSLSLALAAARLRDDPRAYVARVRRERAILQERLDALPSQANFVLARVAADKLREQGVVARAIEGIDGYARITCPGNEDDFDRLLEVLS